MTDKEIAIEVLGRMCDEVSFNDIAQQLEFIAAVRQGMSELDENNDSVGIEKFQPKTPAWTLRLAESAEAGRNKSR